MRDQQIIQLGIDAARVEVQGGDCSQLLANGLHRIFDADAGVGIGRWSLEGPPHTGRIVSAGVPQFTTAEWANLVKWAPHHPTFLKSALSTVPMRVSDEIPLKKFWDTEAWWHIHGTRGGRYPMGVGLGLHNGHGGLIGIHRATRDFSADEAASLSLLREPLQSALRFRAALDTASQTLNTSFESLHRGSDSQSEKHQTLTAREKDVLALVATGRTNIMIGSILGIKERTVRKHLTSVFAKLHISNRTSAAVLYRETSALRRLNH